MGTLRLKRDKPVLTRMRRGRVYQEDPGEASEPFKRNKKREDRPALVPIRSHSLPCQDQQGIKRQQPLPPARSPHLMLPKETPWLCSSAEG